MVIPAHTLRLFPNQEPAALTVPEHRGFLIGRLLAEGDGDDLRWLFSEIAPREAANFVEANGGRQLDRRSRVFWETVLATSASPVAPAATALWPWA